MKNLCHNCGIAWCERDTNKDCLGCSIACGLTPSPISWSEINERLAKPPYTSIKEEKDPSMADLCSVVNLP